MARSRFQVDRMKQDIRVKRRGYTMYPRRLELYNHIHKVCVLQRIVGIYKEKNENEQ